jgi:hypothetical protein
MNLTIVVLTLANIAALVAVALAVRALLKYLPAYVTEKAKNLATKEDIGQVTREVEDVKASYARELEAVRSELHAERERGLTSHRVQFETEFRALTEVWSALARVRARMEPLRPRVQLVNEGETPEQRFQRAFAPFAEAKNEFVRSVDFAMPFYPEAIHHMLEAAVKLLGTEYLDAKTTSEDERTKEWYDRGEANFKRMCDIASDVAGAIREHLATARVNR